MTTCDLPEKCFAAKHLSAEGPSGKPDHLWDLGRLSHFARQQHEMIIQSERSVAPTYWLLGQALALARKQLGRGQWGKYLTELGINRVRACRARAIFRSFSTAEVLQGMGVEEAYEQRQRRATCVRHRRHEATTDAGQETSAASSDENQGTDPLQSFLYEVYNRADQLFDLAAFAPREQREALFPKYQAALARFQQLGKMLGVDDEPMRTGTIVPPGTTAAIASKEASSHGPSDGTC